MFKFNIKKNEEKAIEPDVGLLSRIQHQGGVYALEDDFAALRTGTGYQSCVEIYDFANIIDDYWLHPLCSIDGLTIIDIHTENKEDVRRNLNSTLKEQNSRINTSRKIIEGMDAASAMGDMSDLYDELQNQDKILKSVTIRIYIAAPTEAELQEKEKDIIKSLGEFKGAVMLNEQMDAERAMYISYSSQQKKISSRPGQPILDDQLAKGNPFHFSHLSDPYGWYMGTTPSGGSVIWNPFTKTAKRLYYNILIVGQMGSGKSTILKKIEENLYALGHYIRKFDITGEAIEMALENGGRVINLDGTDGCINMFHVYQTDENEGTSWINHISKLNATYRILSNTKDEKEIEQFEIEAKRMYQIFKIQLDEGRITGKRAEDYPTISSFVTYLTERINEVKENIDITRTHIVEENLLVRLDNIKTTFERVRENYGNILDGPTTLENLTDTQYVVYNMRNIADIEGNVRDAVLYNALHLTWNGAVKNGMVMKKRWEEGQIGLENITYTMITIDELHKLTLINTENPVVVNELTKMAREMRKYFCGMALATQRIADGKDHTDGKQSMSALFSFCNYKFIGNQETSDMNFIKDVFKESLTDAEYETIPTLGLGQFILSIRGDHNLRLDVYITDEEKARYRGGV